MGVFGAIFEAASPKSRKYKKSLYRQEKRAARHRIALSQEAIQFRESEDPREAAFLNQSLFGRGLGKSTIAEQDKGRLGGIQSRRMAALRRQHVLAVHGLDLIKKRHKYQQGQQYAAILDGVLSIAFGAGGGANPNAGGGGGGGGDGGGDSDMAFLYSSAGYA